MFNSKFGVGVLKHPGYNIGGGVGESLLLEQVIQGAVVGGGLSALTGGDFLEGAITGGIGGGIKSFLPDFTKIFSGPGGLPPGADQGIKAPLAAGAQAYTPAAIGSSVATSPWTSEIVSATSPFATAGTSGVSNLAANAFPGVAPDVIQAAQNQVAANAGESLAKDTTQQAINYPKLIQENNLKAVGLTTQPDGPLPNGNYALNGKVYSGAQVANLGGPQSFFEKYKTPIMLGGLGLGYKMLTEKPPAAYTPPAPSGPLMKYRLGPNYAAVPNPTPVYPRFAEGGIAQLADGGRMAPDKVNVDFMHGDMYPMSQQDRSFYASPTQMPIGAQQAVASYEPKTNPLTGQTTAHMASGGTATSGQVYYDADKGQYYTIKGSENPVMGILGAMGGAFGNFGNDTSNRNYIGTSLSGAGISPDFKASVATPTVYTPTYADVAPAPTAASTVAVPTYSLSDSVALLDRTSPELARPFKDMARGGIADLGAYSDGGRMLKGPGDGMSDSIPGVIANKRPARLADGEFVVPADVVSHLGNGSTDAGAKQLYAMMNKVRKARTGTAKQGKQINPRKLMPA